MKYQYGVEYETNGEKPDLPGDVVIECFDGVGWWGGYNYLTESNLTPNELTFKGCVTKKFRIVDKRYKPKEQDMNDWYEKGELPPVGEKVIAIDKRTNADGNKCELRYISSEVCVLYDIYDDCEFAVPSCHVEFRPLRTERDVLVEKMCSDTKSAQEKFNINIDCSVAMRGVMDDLIDAGWRPIKQQTEDEFAAQAQELTDYVSIYQLSKLYRAGCRFIEQVKA